MERYICEKCGKTMPADDTYMITRFFNYTKEPIYVCGDCATLKGRTDED